MENDAVQGHDVGCLDPQKFGVEAPRVLLYSTIGDYSPTYLKMLQIMVKTGLFHLGTQIDVFILAHNSWSPFRSSMNASHVIFLDNEAFFDMQSIAGKEWRGAQQPSSASQSSANKLRIFQLVPAIWSYDIIVMLDTDIVVQANFLLLIGHICHDTLYAASHRPLPELKRTAKWFQARNFNPEELSRIRAKDLRLFNAGQFVFRPSARMEELFRKAYLSYKLNPRASLYEQGHLNTVFLLEGNVKYTLSHLTLLSFPAAMSASPPAAYALIHVCDTAQPAIKKLAAMQRHLGQAFRPQKAVQKSILPRLWRCLDTALGCGSFEERHRRAGEKGRSKGKGVTTIQRNKRTAGGEIGSSSSTIGSGNEAPTAVLRIEDSPELIASFLQFVTQPNVSHMCEVGFHRGRTASLALFANPSARLTVFDPAGLPSSAAAMRNLWGLFAGRVVHLAGDLADNLRTYLSLEPRERYLPCSTLLLPPEGHDEALWRALLAIRAIMAPPGYVFAAGSARWQAAVADGIVSETACHHIRIGPRQGRWCSGMFKTV
eukprot:EG_transcript_4048